MESILATIKKMLGITADCTHFDNEIIVHINTVLLTLSQIGVGPDVPASISGDADTWVGTFGDMRNIEAVKTYIYIKVRLLFDPPASSYVLDSLNRTAQELEWRLNVQTDNGEEE
jgi:hypothetical protein